MWACLSNDYYGSLWVSLERVRIFIICKSGPFLMSSFGKLENFHFGIQNLSELLLQILPFKTYQFILKEFRAKIDKKSEDDIFPSLKFEFYIGRSEIF